MRRLLISLFLLLPALVWGGEPTLQPRAIDSGGVALLHWPGTPPVRGTVHFNGRQAPLWPGADGAFALLGADIDLPAGSYPVTVEGTDSQGNPFVLNRALEIRANRQPEEHLALPREMVTPRKPQTLERIEREQAMLQRLFAAAATEPLWQGFIRPVDDPLGSLFGLRRVLNGQPRAPHPGIDFRSPWGTPVKASGRGRVAFAGELYFSGRTVVLDHGGGLLSLYAHLERILCGQSDLLAQGAILGTVGSSGRSTGPHLHWGFKLAGDRIDPLQILSLLPAKSLTPTPMGMNN